MYPIVVLDDHKGVTKHSRPTVDPRDQRDKTMLSRQCERVKRRPHLNMGKGEEEEVDIDRWPVNYVWTHLNDHFHSKFIHCRVGTMVHKRQ
jgi:hypothetical protein